MRAVAFSLIAVVFVALAVCSRAQFQTTYVGDLSITTFDNFTLHGNGYAPVPTAPGQVFPVVIFANSWGYNYTEYQFLAQRWAATGYVTFEYETRGFFGSSGTINVGGPLDRRDISTVIDFVLSHGSEWNVNASAIAMAGLSYGADLSIMAAGFEPRISAIVSLCGWTNITLMLYLHNTVNNLSISLLNAYADAVGHPSVEMHEMLNDLLTHRNMDQFAALAAERSSIANISFMNERRVAMFISNNFQDSFITSNNMIQFWQQLQGPKFMLLNQGGHGGAAGFGFLNGIVNLILTKAKMWLDQHLKGIDTGILSEPPVQMQIEYQGSNYRGFSGWPDAAVQAQKWLIGNRGASQYGQLVAAPGPAPVAPGPLDSIVFSTSTGINNGIPSTSDEENQYFPTLNFLSTYQQNGAVVYLSAPLPAETLLCGEPTFRIQFTPSSSDWQLYAFLYSVDGLGIGAVISDGYVSNYANGNGAWREGVTEVRTRTETTADGGAAMVVDVASTLRMLCLAVPANNSVGLAFTLYSEPYLPVNQQLGVTFQYTNESYVTIPVCSI